MDINEAFRSAYSTLVSNTSEVLPFYFMGISVPAVARVAPLVSSVFVYLALVRRGNIDEISSAIENLPTEELEDTDGFENPESFGEFDRLGNELTEIAELVFVPEVIAIVAVAFLGFFLITVVLNAVVNAGQISAVYAVLTAKEDAVKRGIDGILTHSSSLVRLILLEISAVVGLTAIFALVGAGAVSVGGIVGGALGIVVALAWVIAVLFVHVLFVFAPQSVVIDKNGAIDAVRGNIKFLSDNPVEFVAYTIFVFAALVGFASVSGFFNVFGAPAVTSVVFFLVFSPFVGIVKTDMYTRHAGDEVVVSDDGTLSRDPIVGALRVGWEETVSFTLSRPVLVAFTGLVFVGSAVGAWQATVSAGVGFETSIADRLAETTLFGEFFNYTANNWSVGVAQAYAGFVFGVATVVSVVFNGVVFGLLTATEQNPVELLAFVVPHGVIEIPALLISGALGLHLGGVSLAYARGKANVERLSEEVRRAYRVFLGLLVLFTAAGFIEAFVSPYYYGPLFGI
jgi:uncharacterized membrane protein SpoIIM required for sporulation